MKGRRITCKDIAKDDKLLKATRSMIDNELTEYDLGNGEKIYKDKDGFYIRKE